MAQDRFLVCSTASVTMAAVCLLSTFLLYAARDVDTALVCRLHCGNVKWSLPWVLMVSSSVVLVLVLPTSLAQWSVCLNEESQLSAWLYITSCIFVFSKFNTWMHVRGTALRLTIAPPEFFILFLYALIFRLLWLAEIKSSSSSSSILFQAAKLRMYVCMYA